LASFADKAQSAINASPLAGHLPANLSSRPTSPDAAINHLPMMLLRKAVINHTHSTQFSINFALCSSSMRKLASTPLCDISQLILSRSTSPVQKVITAEKGVAIDFDSVSRDSKAQSKELYTWGQSEAEDLKDGKLSLVPLGMSTSAYIK